jgi:phosphohistidine phosphatase SixA
MLKPVILFAIVALFAFPSLAARAVIVIRHAEKESQGDDPELTISGQDRAIALTRFLRHDKVDAIFVSEFKRTQETAEILAHQREITPVIVKAGDTKALIDKINALPKDAVVVVVGHSNTVPDILAALGVKDKVAIKDQEFNRVFIVTPFAGGDATMLEFVY